MSADLTQELIKTVLAVATPIILGYVLALLHRLVKKAGFTLSAENEARLEVEEAKGELDVVYPPISIRAEPHVAVVDASVDRKRTRAAAEAYLKYLYTDAAQEIIARHFYRPSSEAVLKRHAATFPSLRLFSVKEIALDFPDAHKQFIAEGGVFDRIYKPR